MASEWVAAIIETPYLLVPLMAWLWDLARFPKVKWGKVAGGALLTLAGKLMQMLLLALGPSLGNEVMAWPGAFITILANVSTVAGLIIIAAYVLAGALSSLKSNA
jgi:hypothetical protein